MKYAANRSLRETLYRASSTRASGDSPYDNESIIKEILAIRQQLAKLLGFPTYADVSISKKMASSVQEVEQMHEDLRAKCLDIAKQEIDTLMTFARANGQQEELAPWDLAYWYVSLAS